MSDTETVETEPKAKKAKARVACLCGQVEAIYKAESVPSRTAKNGWALGVERGQVKASIACEADTTSKFAPGHDSRLVGLLQDAVRTDPAATVKVNGGKPENLVDWITGLSEHLAVKVLAEPKPKPVKAKAEESEADEADEAPKAKTTSRRRRTV